MSKVWAHLHLPRYKRGDFECISVKTPGESVCYLTEISLKDAAFFVSAKGRERCIKTGQRNVHAWVIGTQVQREWDYRGWRKAVYDPWKGDSFVDTETLQPVHWAPHVHMIGKEVYYAE